MRALALLALAAALAAPVGAQAPADTARTVTIPAPDGPGVIYVRSGERGPPRVRQRAAPARADRQPAAQTALARRAARAPRGVSRLDLVLLEQSILRALDERLAALAADRSRGAAPLPARPQAPVIVLPGAPDAPAVPDAAPVSPVVPLPPDSPLEPPSPLVEEIERAILDLSLIHI